MRQKEREIRIVSNIKTRMFVLIWVALLFSVRGCNADTGSSLCYNGFCITLNEGEITAEAGLCAVIPCSFTTGSRFTPYYLVWFKCEPSKPKCGDSDVIFHSYKHSTEVESGFRGRVSLLESYLYRRNCSIIINDLTESDSGSYQLRVIGYRDGFTYTTRATVSVKGLTQKPTLMIPPLAEGQQTTLTCTAPGLCSGSDPNITWTWSGAGENDSYITDFKTEDVTAVRRRHSSTLTFNPSAEHHGSSVTCKVSFPDNITTEETMTLNVTHVKEVKITGNTSVKEGETLNLTCSVESFPPSLITWTTFPYKNMTNGTETHLQDDTPTHLQDDTPTHLQDDTPTHLQGDTETYPGGESGVGIFSISNVTAEHSGQYTCTAKYLNNTLMEKVDVTVMYIRKPVITGDTTVAEGRALNLTCSVESIPPSQVTWTILGSDTNLHNKPDTDLRNNNGSATLVIHNVTVEDAGQYICTAKHLDTTVTADADVTVTWFSKILNSSCTAQSEVLTCVCISEGFPLPTIKWPLLENHTMYSVLTTVSNHTVNSTFTLTVKGHNSPVVECVSGNDVGEARENLVVRLVAPEQKDQFREEIKVVSWLEVIIAFLIGVLLSAVICCLAIKCHRKKQKGSGYLDETLEMVTNQEDPLIDAGQAVEDDQTYYQEAAEEEEGEGAVAAEKAAIDLDGGPKDVQYASIDFSVLKRKAAKKKEEETTKTEYAEIKKEVKVEGEENVGEEGEVMEDREEEAMIGEDEETNHCVQDEEEWEDVGVYSNVKDIMGEI